MVGFFSPNQLPSLTAEDMVSSELRATQRSVQHSGKRREERREAKAQAGNLLHLSNMKEKRRF